MIARRDCELAYSQAVAACDPARLVRDALAGRRFDVAIAIGKAAVAMARGAGPVARGIVVAPQPGDVPAGWRVMVGSHPVPDEKSLAAGAAVMALVRAAEAPVLALVSGGASALCEVLAPGVTLEQWRAEIRDAMQNGANIHAINERRKQLSAIKGGKLAAMCPRPIATLAISDVFDNDLAVIGSGPTIAGRPDDTAKVIAPMRLFAEQFAAVLHRSLDPEPTTYDVADVACPRGTVAWGEPTLTIPRDHGVGGRMQQLALAWAKRLRGGDRSAFCAGSDGVDGPAPPDRPAPAGAFVDGNTWDLVAAAGIDPELALARRDAGTALDAVGALFVPGPTGVNHADVMIVG